MDDFGQLAIIDHEGHLGRACHKGIPTDLAGWGKKNIGFAIAAPVLPFTDSELIAVSKCTLGNCETAYLTYVRNGKRFSVFILPEKEADFFLHNNKNYTLGFDTYRVTIWKSKQQMSPSQLAFGDHFAKKTANCFIFQLHCNYNFICFLTKCS